MRTGLSIHTLTRTHTHMHAHAHTHAHRQTHNGLDVWVGGHLVWLGMTHVTMIALAVGAAVLALSSYVLIYALGMGFVGAPVAVALCWWTLPVITWAYVWWRGLHRPTWQGWSRASLRGWGKFLRLGIPGMLMLMYVRWFSAAHTRTRTRETGNVYLCVCVRAYIYIYIYICVCVSVSVAT
jgi:hypothetical protein